jgi:hypothetical protein
MSHEFVEPSKIIHNMMAALTQLDGSDAAAVSLLTGLSRERLDDLGGFGK